MKALLTVLQIYFCLFTSVNAQAVVRPTARAIEAISEFPTEFLESLAHSGLRADFVGVRDVVKSSEAWAETYELLAKGDPRGIEHFYDDLFELGRSLQVNARRTDKDAPAERIELMSLIDSMAKAAETHPRVSRDEVSPLLVLTRGFCDHMMTFFDRMDLTEIELQRIMGRMWRRVLAFDDFELTNTVGRAIYFSIRSSERPHVLTDSGFARSILEPIAAQNGFGLSDETELLHWLTDEPGWLLPYPTSNLSFQRALNVIAGFWSEDPIDLVVWRRTTDEVLGLNPRTKSAPGSELSDRDLLFHTINRPVRLASIRGMTNFFFEDLLTMARDGYVSEALRFVEPLISRLSQLQLRTLTVAIGNGTRALDFPEAFQYFDRLATSFESLHRGGGLEDAEFTQLKGMVQDILDYRMEEEKNLSVIRKSIDILKGDPPHRVIQRVLANRGIPPSSSAGYRWLTQRLNQIFNP